MTPVNIYKAYRNENQNNKWHEQYIQAGRGS